MQTVYNVLESDSEQNKVVDIHSHNLIDIGSDPKFSNRFGKMEMVILINLNR